MMCIDIEPLTDADEKEKEKKNLEKQKKKKQAQKKKKEQEKKDKAENELQEKAKQQEAELKSILIIFIINFFIIIFGLYSMTYLELEKDVKKEHDTKVLTMSDREKRALAAEKRLLATKGTLSNLLHTCLLVTGVITTCEYCKNEIIGVPFERLEFKYCSTKCVVGHKKVIGR